MLGQQDLAGGVEHYHGFVASGGQSHLRGTQDDDLLFGLALGCLLTLKAVIWPCLMVSVTVSVIVIMHFARTGPARRTRIVMDLPEVFGPPRMRSHVSLRSGCRRPVYRLLTELDVGLAGEVVVARPEPARPSGCLLPSVTA